MTPVVDRLYRIATLGLIDEVAPADRANLRELAFLLAAVLVVLFGVLLR